MSTRWRQYFLNIAVVNARMSKDPSTKVGAVIVGENRNILATGFNGFPAGIKDTQERLLDRNTKMELVVHAELNAILSAARNGIKLADSTLYIVCVDAKTDKIWGTPPCVRCTVEIIQAGIKHVVYGATDLEVTRDWDKPLTTLRLFDEAGISVTKFLLC